MSEILLTPDQKNAYEKVLEFLKNPNEDMMRISSPAGCGKTFLISYLVDKLFGKLNKGIYPGVFNMAVTATTHKAVAAIAEKLDKYFEGFGGSPVIPCTVHSFLNLRVSVNPKNQEENILCKKEPGKQDIRNYLIIVDEASMISQELWKYMGSETKDCKWLFIGDKYQLAPVKDPVSNVYRFSIPEATLHTLVRNEGHDYLQKVCQDLREGVINTSFKEIVPDGVDVIALKDDEEAKAYIDKTFAKENINACILGYTNKKIIQYNEYVRKLRNYKERYVPDMYLISNTYYKVQDNKIILNNELVHLEHVKEACLEQKYSLGSRYGLKYVPIQLYGDEFYGHWFRAMADYNLTDYVLKQLVKEAKETGNWREYFFIKDNYLDLRPRDASTVHKAQGSTFDEVFVDMYDLGSCTSYSIASRLLYVAISRARKRVYLYGNLPDRFFNY